MALVIESKIQTSSCHERAAVGSGGVPEVAEAGSPIESPDLGTMLRGRISPQ